MKNSISALLAAVSVLAFGGASYAQSSMEISFDQTEEISAENQAAIDTLAACIVEERRSLASRYLRHDEQERLRLLLPLISPPCTPADGTRLNVPSLENKLRELLDA